MILRSVRLTVGRRLSSFLNQKSFAIPLPQRAPAVIAAPVKLVVTIQWQMSWRIYMTYLTPVSPMNLAGRRSYLRGARVAVRKAAAVSLEMLEPRLMLAAVSWIGGTGNWNVAANWNDDIVPNSNDDVTISVAGSVVNITDDQQVNSVTTAAGTTLNLNSGGTLRIGVGTIAGTFNGGAGTTLSDRTLAFSGTSQLTAMTVNGGTVTNSGAMTVNETDLLGLNFTNQAGATLIFAQNSSLQNSTTFTNANGATFTLSDLTGITNDNNRNGTFLNNGLFILNGGPGTASIAGTTLEDIGGTIHVESGTLSDEFTAFFQGASFNVDAGGAFAFDSTNNGDQFFFSGTTTGGGAGNLFFNGGEVLSGEVNANPTSSILNFPTAGFAQVTGTYFGVNPQDGAVNQVTNAGFLDYVGSATHGDLGLINAGTIEVTGTGDIGVGSQGAFTNEASGVIDFVADASFIDLGGNTAFTNMGTIEKTGGTGTSSINFDGNDGGTGTTVDAETGTIDYPSGFAFSNTTFKAAAGAAISLDSTSNGFGFSGSITGSGAGNLLFVSAANVPYNPNGPAPSATLNFAAGFADVTGGGFQGNPQDGPVYEITNDGFLNFVGSAAHPGIGLINDGTIDVLGGDLDVNGTPFINDAAGILNFETDANVTNPGGNPGGFTNMGLIEKSGGAGDTIIGSGTNGIGFASTDGSYDVESGTLTLSDGGGTFGYTLGNGTVVAAPGTVFALAGVVFLSGNPTITGGGTYELTGGELRGPNGGFNQDTTTPATLDFAAGTFLVNGGDIADNTGVVNTGTIDYVGASELDGIDNKGTIVFDAGPLRVAGNIINEAGGLLDFTAAQQILALGNNGLLSNAGSVVFSPGAGNTFDLSQINATNSGTFFITSGTLNLPWIPNQYVEQPGLFPNGYIPAGSTFVVDAGATVTVATTPNFTNLAGTVILGGASASFPALAGLTTLTGELSVLSGASFTTAGNLTNSSGTLSIGGNVTVTGNYTQTTTPFGSSTGAPTLDFEVDAAPNTAGAPSFTVQGNTSLSGNLTADYVNGFTTAGGTYTVATFSGGMTGSFASTSGVGPFFTAGVSSTQIQLNGAAFTGTGGSTPLPMPPTISTITPPPPPSGTTADLTVSAVTAPATFAPGSQQTITWTVTNTGPGAAAGNWQDSVFLSADGVIDSSSILIGRATHNGSLADGASYSGTLTAFMPAVTGAYTVLVEADSGGAVTNDVRTGDVATSATTTGIAPTLAVGTPTSDTITLAQQRVYSLTLTAGTDVNLKAVFAAALEANIYIGDGVIPTPEVFDQSATAPTQTSANFLLHAAQTTTYYIVVYGRGGATLPESFTLTPTLLPYGPASVTPSAGADIGEVTLTINGAGFTPSTTVTLVSAIQGASDVPAQSVIYVNPNQVYAIFRLADAVPGTYSVLTTQGTNGPRGELAGAFTVDEFGAGGATTGAASGGQLEFFLSAPTFIRAGTAGTLTLFYENVGGTDIAAPLFEITADNASFQLAGQDDFTDNLIDVIGTNPTGPAGLLTPGASGSVQITFEQDAPGAHVVSNFEAYALDPSAKTDWDALKKDLKPATASQAGWDQTFANFENIVGTTIGSYDSVLANLADYLGTQGIRTTDASFYLGQELEIAGDFGAIEACNAFSDLGYGQIDPYDASLTLDSAGDAAVGNGENVRYFVTAANGTFSNVDPSDGGVLVHNSDGTYTLTETTGEKTVFNSDGSLNSFYNIAGNKTTVTLTNGFVTQMTDAFGGITTINRYSDGVINQIIDPQGRSTTFGYDGSGNLVSVANDAGTTQFAFADPTNHEVTEITNPNGTHQFFGYDSFGRVITESLDGNADALTFSYDSNGNITQTDALGHAVTLGRVEGSVTSIKDSLGNVLQATYGALSIPATTTDALGLGTVMKTDSAGDVTAIISASGAKVAILYDDNHHPLSITDPNGHPTSFTYDANGNILTSTDASGAVNTNTFTALNLLQQSSSAAGRVIQNTYNTAGQLIGQTFSDGTSASYSYDPHGNMISATNASGTDTFSYDSADRLTKVSYSDGLSLTYTYNNNGQLSQTVDQTGFATNYAYNAQGQLDKLTDSAGNMLAAYTYNIAGDLARTDLGNGTFTVYGYDADGRVNSVVNHAADGSVLSSFTYIYDGDGQITSMTTLAGVTTYTYNDDGELATAVLPGSRTLTWTYDAAGNRISATDSGASTVGYTSNNLNEYTAAGGTVYTYDADGNLTSSTDSSGTTTYTYNVQEELTSIAAPSGTTTFSYDALGDRMTETVNGVTTDLLVDPLSANGLAGVFSTSGTAEAQFIEGLGLVGESLSSGAANYYSFDMGGNVADLTNSSGAVLDSYTYLPFGQTLTATGSTANPFTFDGRDGVQSVGGGNYLTQTRLYSSTLGRFTQRDPNGVAGGDTNLYRYVKNNPVTYNDPTGGFLEIPSIAEVALSLSTHFPEPFSGVFVDSAGNAIVGSTAASSTGFVSSVAANTGTYFSSAGNLLTSSAGAGYANLGAAATGGTPVVFTEATTADITLTVGSGSFVEAGGALVAVPAIPVTVVVAGTAGLFYEANSAGKTYSNEYQRAITTGSQDDAIDKNNIIQHLRRTALGRDLLAIQTNGGTDPATLSLDTLEFYLQQASQAQQQTQTQAVTSHDPNEIIGPSGFGSAGFIPGGEPLSYQIDFTNESTASAPAQTVTVTQQLSANVDLSTFQLGNIGFGSTIIAVPAGLQTFSTMVSISSTLSVDVTANLDAATGIVTWTFTSIDSTTGDVPSDPLSGFLPPDTTPPNGEGFVDYTVLAKANSPTGTAINAQATVVFDDNAPISTALITNTIDAGAPTSTVAALAASQTSPNFVVSWSGQDDANGSGIASYTLFVSDNGGAFSPVLTTTNTSTVFEGTLGHTYGFYTIATDNAGNSQPVPSAAQAQTTVPAADRFVTFGGKTKGTYIDAQGNLVTVTLSGPGTATLGFIGDGHSDPVSLVVTGTTAKSVLTLTGKGTTTLTGVQITGSLGNFNAKTANLAGSFDITGSLGAMTLNNVNTGATTIHVEGGGTTTFKFGAIQDLLLTVAGTIKSLTALSWTGGTLATGLTAAAIGTLSVKGAFDTNLSLTSGSLSATLGSIGGGDWTLGGALKSLTTGAVAAGWSAVVTGDVGTVSVKGNFGGSLTARSLKSLKVTGSVNASTITLTGAAAALGKLAALGTLTVTGSVSNSTISALGTVGTVTVGGQFLTDSLSAAVLTKLSVKGAVDSTLSVTGGTLTATVGSLTGGDWTIGGAISSLTTGTIAAGWTGVVTGNIGTLTVKGDLDGSLTARSIKSLKVSGNINASTITLTGSAATLGKLSALGALAVTGTVSNSTISAGGNVGAVTVGGMNGSTLYAGITSGTTGLPTAGDINAAASILSFTSKGKTPFAASDIAAETIGALTLENVTTANGGTPFGVATHTLKSFSLQQPRQKAVVWRAKQSTAVFNTLPGDLHVDLV
jgi:RHS repeat-associated protein